VTGACSTGADGGKATSSHLNYPEWVSSAGTVPSALLSNPYGASVDTAGNVYIGDTANNRIQELAATPHTQWGISMKAGDIYTVAGSAAGTAGNSGDRGRATSALLKNPLGLAASSSGDLYIADAYNNLLGEVAANGTRWAQTMTAGDLYAVAGSTAGTSTDTGSGGPAAGALLYDPSGVTTDAAGDVFIPDMFSSTFLEITATASQAFPVYPVGGNITVTQPGSAQVTFYPQVAGACPTPDVPAGGFRVTRPSGGHSWASP
jgi:hypothetical protein